MLLVRIKSFALLILIFFVISDIPQNMVSAQESVPTIRAEVSLVNVFFTAKDRRGQPIQNLTADDFQVSENRKAQKILSKARIQGSEWIMSRLSKPMLLSCNR